MLIDVDRAGVNYADLHIREDNYIADVALPYVLGSEVVGRRQSDGRRVLGLTVRGGGYAQCALAPRGTTFEVPDGIDDDTALALGVQGNTAWHLLHTCARIQPGESVVIFAAAGGVGTVAIQLARLAGAGRIIAAASTPAKRQLTLDLGADAAIDSAGPGHLTAQLIAANGGRKVDIVLEMTGSTSTKAALDALAPFGRLVAFGYASGKTATLNTLDIMVGSRSVIGFVLPQIYPIRGMLAHSMNELSNAVLSGALTPCVGGTYPLSEVQHAHTYLETRRTTGKLLLDPGK
ncbi:zinc-binding dehydrogenase [Streptomyces sp. H10-C2]|uniref:quinone oxidoreductase family protein n=1 Tax=unclassified Streptomyces TaxID=2593676 RepID=UPI0024BBD4AA|nr:MULTISPECIES: zinc-binding dehydrogenase [unclassified Streptomyces]MDJ0344115.1 zinc-binding dehydrogenase [Streptomyces sp. PH10-H1]MDJ0374871.1 zinc-binding dehydrogenase [Streptomyces sp. H10-C2]